MFYRYNNNHKSLVDLSQFLSAKYINHVHTITLKYNQKFHQLHRSREEKNTRLRSAYVRKLKVLPCKGCEGQN